MTGNELKEIRENFAFTQEELAAALGVVSSSVARWEQLKEKEIPSPLLPLALEAVGARLKAKKTR